MACYPAVVPDWNNHEIIHRNTLPARPHFFIYDEEGSAIQNKTEAARAQCLSGTWKFHLSETPLEGPRDFYETGFDVSGFDDIQVPGMWQCQGYGHGPHYANIQYPWPVDPPHIPLEYNECGRYVTTFTVNREFIKDSQIRLRFEGVDSSFSVWLNGKKVGYSQGSRNPSEFDVTDLVEVDIPGGNTLAVEVYKLCNGSYIEDQDQWYLSGIFRDVFLHSFPKTHPVDFQVETELDGKYEHAVLRVKIEMSEESQVEVKLTDKGREIAKVSKQFGRKQPETLEIPVVNPNKWTAETPYLYDLVISFGAVITHRIGFRKTELIGGVFHINGNPIKFRGVNRHEHHPDSGRTVPLEFLRHDLTLMKLHGLNAIRMSHQINDFRLYELADELGLWILDEADLECHGFDEIGLDNPARYLSDNPEWEASYVDRAVQMVQRDKNFTCVIMWSLGNESFYGRNHQVMYDEIRKIDTTRLIHYEGDQEAKTADIYSRMYPPVDKVVNMAEGVCVETNKPLLLCEYIHAMGNGPGGIKEYIDAFYKYPRLMGGFLWEWSNHGLRSKSEDGEEFMAYGGDFGDVPNDYNFVMDGCVFSDHTPTPGLIEYTKAIEPVQTLSLVDDVVTIINRYDFISLDHLACSWRIVADGSASSSRDIEIPRNVKPHTRADMVLTGFNEVARKVKDKEAYLQIHFRLRDATTWAPKDHQIAFGELQLSLPKRLPIISSSPTGGMDPKFHQVSGSKLKITSASGSCIWTFDLARGTLIGWNRDGQEIISQPLTMDFYRALTDNDREIHGRGWITNRLHQTKHYVREVRWHEIEGGVEVQIKGRIAPPVLAWGVDVQWFFTFKGDQLLLRVIGSPHGAMLPEFFARIGVTFGLAEVSGVSWWGRGPGESYSDKKLSQSFGNWNSSVDDLFVDYEFPQESGNRTDVRWVEFSSKDKFEAPALRASFGDLEGASFSALHFTTRDLDECTHPYELHKRKRQDTIVRLDWAHHGLGTGSCGPPTMPNYQLVPKDFDFVVLLS